MTQAQRTVVAHALWKVAKTFTHGSCIGADEQAHISAWCLDIQCRKRASNDARLTAECPEAEQLGDPAPPLVRNRRIVHGSDLLLATPKGFKPGRGGTWYTIKYAMECGVPVIIIWPDGTWKCV